MRSEHYCKCGEMREKERDSREREEETQWNVVHRKKPKTLHTQASQTCFINRLPPSTTIPEIAQIFRIHGDIANIFITHQKHSTHKFAFVQFHYPQSLQTAIRDEHGRTLKGFKLIV